MRPRTPAVLLFRFTDFPTIRAAVAPSNLPRAYLTALCYLFDVRHKGKMTLFDLR